MTDNQTNEEPSGRVQGSKIRLSTIVVTLVVTLLLLFFVGIESRQGNLGSAMALSLALAAVGYLVGLLFAVPKSVATAQPVTAPAAVNEDGSPIRQSPISINTNFEQISDWLTKIIVGVGLVQARPIYEAGSTAAAHIGAAIACRGVCTDTSVAGGEVLGAAMLVGFPTLGLIAGFFSVRLFIARAIYYADSSVLESPRSPFEPRDVREVDSISAISQRRSSVVEAPTNPVATAAANEILTKPFTSLVNPDDKATWGKASLAVGNFGASIEALGSAMSDLGDRPDVAVAYVDALYGATDTPDYGKIIAILEGARRQLSSQTPVSIRRRVFEELINAYLYSAPPNGFQAALRLLDEYLAGDGKDQSSAYVYAAAAHGQKYSWLKQLGEASASSELVAIISLVSRAIDLGGIQTKRWLQALASGTSIDNDLVDARTDSEDLRAILA